MTSGAEVRAVSISGMNYLEMYACETDNVVQLAVAHEDGSGRVFFAGRYDLNVLEAAVHVAKQRLALKKVMNDDDPR